MVEVRPCTAEELGDGLRPIFHYFGSAPTEERLEMLSPVLPPERLHAAFDDGEAIAGAGVFEFQLTVPGGRVPAAGVRPYAVFLMK